jgi:hypothetical protein
MLYEVKVAVQKPTKKKDVFKRAIEHYIVDGCSLFAEAEAKGYEIPADGEKDVTAVFRSRIIELVNAPEGERKYAYKATIVSVYTNDDGDESETKYQVLVFARSLDDAHSLIKEYMESGLQDMRLDGIQGTKILDIL